MVNKTKTAPRKTSSSRKRFTKKEVVKAFNLGSTAPLSNTKFADGIIMVTAPGSSVEKTAANKVITYGLDNKENGYILELAKEGKYTMTYLNATNPGAFKGYHLHKVCETNYVCIKGKIKVIVYTDRGREEYVLSADKPEYFHIPVNIPIGLSNEWKEEAWLINYPSPAYDPELKNEQLEFTEEDCENGRHR